MGENKAQLERMAQDWIEEFMFVQNSFKTMDVLKAMPLKHLGIDFDKAELCDKRKDYVYDLVESLIPECAEKYGYDRDAHGVWRVANFDDKKQKKVKLTANGKEASKDLKLSPPFENYCKKLRALFGQDPDVTILEDAEENVINICVAGCDKPSAYRIFFPGEMELPFGKVTILVNGHKKTYETVCDAEVLKRMYVGNPIVNDIIVTKFANGDPNRLFVVFNNQTIQFKNDNFGSLYGVTTTTPEELAKDVLRYIDMVIWYMTDSDLAIEENQNEIID